MMEKKEMDLDTAVILAAYLSFDRPLWRGTSKREASDVLAAELCRRGVDVYGIRFHGK